MMTKQEIKNACEDAILEASSGIATFQETPNRLWEIKDWRLWCSAVQDDELKGESAPKGFWMKLSRRFAKLEAEGLMIRVLIAEGVVYYARLRRPATDGRERNGRTGKKWQNREAKLSAARSRKMAKLLANADAFILANLDQMTEMGLIDPTGPFARMKA